MALTDITGIRYQKRKQLDLQIDNFKGGVNDLLSETRLDKNQSAQAKNLILVEDGLWRPRWGTEYYGTDAGGSIVDGFVEYRKSDGTRELIIFANDLAQKSTDDGDTWATISGYTPTAGTPVQAIQVGDYLYACNGTDKLSRYDGSSFTSYSTLTTPANLSATRNTLGDGDITYYYTVTAHNDIGETLAATEANETVDEDRSLWSGDDAIDLDWDNVTNADYYTVYFGTASGYLEKLLDVSESSYSDDGSVTPNPYIEPPEANTTEGPYFKYMTVSQGRLWGTGDPNNEWRVYFSGKGTRLGIFSWVYGGGWIDLDKGSKAVTGGIIDFQNYPAVFCPTADGRGSIWQIELDYNETWEFWDPSATKITNQISSIAPRSIVQVENDVFFATTRGVYILGNEPNITSAVLRTNELSSNIRPYIEAFDKSDLEDMCAYYKDGKVLFSTPDEIFYYDRERLCWVEKWTTGVAQFGQYTDTNDNVWLLGGMSDDGYLVKFSENVLGDLGTAFETVYISPRFAVEKDWTGFAKIDKAYIRLRHPVGPISFTVLGTEKGEAFSSLISETFTPGASNTGWNWDKWNTFKWNTSDGTPSTFSAESYIKYMRVKKRLRDIQFKVTTSQLNSKFTLLGIKAKGRPVATHEPSTWRLSS